MPDCAGIFVGGRGARMGGAAKGMLATESGETLVGRWQRLFAELGMRAVLVGRHEAYEGLGMTTIADDPPGIGPLGGLIALLKAAGDGRAVAVACDMPFVSIELLRRLVAHPPGAPIVAAKREDLWEPLFARYDAARVLATAETRARAGEHSLQGLLAELQAESLPIDSAEASELRDWDRPEDRWT